MSGKPRPTSQEAFNRIFWDPRLNRDAFFVAYSDRKAPGGVCEVPLVRWDPDGNVPWHRIVFIRCGTEVVWSREEAVDRLASGALPAEAWLAQQALPAHQAAGGHVRSRALYRHWGDSWEVARAIAHPEVTSFRLATWNVLHDFDDPAIPALGLRLPLIREELARTGADIMALQEVTPAAVHQLLAGPRAEPVFLSEPPTGAGLDPHGAFLLSRYSFSLAEHAAGHRPVPVGTWQFGQRLVHVANVHLPSNRTADAALHRRRLLAGLVADLESLPGDILLVGDFNLTGDELGDLVTAAGYQDVWNLLHPGEEGSTFDPPHNPLARQSSRTGLPVRFDRVLWKPAPNGFVPVNLERFAIAAHDGPQGPSFASDHYGLCSTWQAPAGSDTLAALVPVHQSALVIIPPATTWPRIQAIRERHDRHVDRWPPHLNLLYGFIPEEHFAAAARQIAPALADRPPFDLALEEYGCFTHKHSCTAWLRPVASPPEALRTLQARLQQMFPRCTEQSQRSPEGFTPHLSVGQFPSAKEARALLPPWERIQWQVDHVTLIARAGTEPFRSVFAVPLGGGAVRQTEPASAGSGDLGRWLDQLHPEVTDHGRTTCRAILEQVGDVAASITGRSRAVHLAGSWRLGVAEPASDVDLIGLHPPQLTRQDFLQQLHDRLLEQADDVSLVAEARVPKVSCRLHGQRVDILAASTSLSEFPSRATPVDFTDAESWQAARACVESDLVLEVAEQTMPVATFRQLLRAVRAWAQVRRVHSNAWGFLGGFPWALLSAWTASQPGPKQAPAPPARTAGAGTFLAHFFSVLTRHPWPQPVALTAGAQRYEPQGPRDRLPIVRPVEPFENTAYNITASTARTLRSEWSRAARLFAQGAGGDEVLAQIFAPVDLRTESEHFIVLSLNGEPAARAELAGRVEGRLVGLLVDLERKRHLHVRPWPGVVQHEPAARLVLGLPALRPRDQKIVRQLVGNFMDGVGGAEGVRIQIDVCDRGSDLLP